MEEKVISHRGHKGDFIENSKPAFEKALKDNLSFETDIRLSKDKVPLLIHDKTLDRLFNGSGKIKNYNSNELKRFSYKKDFSLNLFTLKGLCELIKKNDNHENLIFIHIKELDAIPYVMDILQEYNFKNRIRLYAVDEITLDLINIIRKEYPKYKLGLHLPENSPNYTEEKFKLADFIWADEITFKWVGKEKVDLAHKLGKPLYVISPELIPESIFNEDIEKRWGELLDYGIDRIITGKIKKFEMFLKRNFEN